MSRSLAAAFTAAAAAQGDLPVTAGVARWNEAGRPITADALARVHQVMLADMGGRADGSGRIRPSSVGHPCTRHKLLSFLGAERTEFEEGSLDIMEAGTWGHYRWQVRGLSGGWLTAIEEPAEDRSWLLKGSADGIISDGSLFELKTTNSYTYDTVMKTGEPTWEHRMQVGAMLRALEIDKASIVYEDRNFPARWHEFRWSLSGDEAILFALKLLRKDIRTQVRAKELPPMLVECVEMKGKIYEGCQFRYSCPAARWPS